MSSLAQDVEQTAKDVGSTLNHVTFVGMIASLAASGVFGYLLSGHDPIIASESVLIAVAVDYALFRWLRISKRLRKAEAETTAGKALDRVAAGMTFYLNGLAGVAPLIPAKSPTAYVLLTVAHLFIPTMMLLSYIAMPGAQLKLQARLAEVLAEEERLRRAATSEQETSNRTARARDDARADQIRKDQIKAKELDTEKHQREMADRHEARVLEERASVRSLTGALLVSVAMRAVAMATMHSGNTSPAPSRQPVTSPHRQPSPAPVASPSPAGRQPVASPRRQPASPAVAKSPPAATPDFDRLVALAKELLAREPSMGRPTLAKQLAEATGERVTDHLVKRVRAAIQDEHEAQFKAELESVLDGKAGS